MRHARIIFGPIDLNKPLINAEFPESAVPRSVIIIALDMQRPDSIAYRVHRANPDGEKHEDFKLARTPEESNHLSTIGVGRE